MVRFPEVGTSLALRRNREIRFAPAVVCALLKAKGLPVPVSPGFHLLIKPLSKGTHTIHVYGEADVSLIGGPRVIMDATYQLTVGN